MTGTLLHKSDKQGKQKSILQQTLHKDNTFLCRGFQFSFSLLWAMKNLLLQGTVAVSHKTLYQMSSYEAKSCKADIFQREGQLVKPLA